MIRVVVVDPDETARRELVNALEHAVVPGTVVGQADRGGAALAMIGETRPQLILSEAVLPDLSADELLRCVRDREYCPELIFYSERQDFLLLRSALRYGVLDYLLKPLSHQELNEALRRLLQRHNGAEGVRLLEARPMSDNRYVSEALRHIAANYGECGLSVRSIARALDISEGHLSRLFRAKTGYTLKHYLTLYRIGIAEDLLSSGRSRVYETARQVGYQDVAYFSNTFKRIVGVSPTEYRNEQ